jgi:hypothetical protein
VGAMKQQMMDEIDRVNHMNADELVQDDDQLQCEAERDTLPVPGQVQESRVDLPDARIDESSGEVE